MKQYLHNDRELFEELITLVAEEMGLPEAAVLRDYYITYILDNLSQSDFKEHWNLLKGEHPLVSAILVPSSDSLRILI